MGMRGVVKGPGNFVVRAVKSSDVVMRAVQLPPSLDEEAMLGAIAFKAEEELPFPAEEALFVVAEPKMGLFFATKKDRIPKEPCDAVAPVPLALILFASYFSLPDSLLLIYGDEEEVTFIEIAGQTPTLCTVIKRGRELEKEFARRQEAYGWGADTPTLVLGERIISFGEELLLERRFGLPPDELHSKALMIGLCLLPFSLPIERFDFGSKRIALKKMQIVKPLILSLVSLVVLYTASEEWLRKQELALVTRMGTSNVQEYVDLAQAKRVTALYPYPLKPQAPTFSDLLAWISSQAPEGLQIDKIHYSYISMPTVKSPKERYVVQVDTTFLVDSVQVARLFHERLVTPNPFVVQDAHFVWQSSPAGYRTSFRLKDRVTYELS